MLAQSMARKFAIAMDVAALFGISSGSVVAPGLQNEAGTGTRFYTGGSAGSYVAPVDTTEFSKVLELIRAVPDEPTGGILTNPQVVGTMARLQASTYAKYWEFTKDIQDTGLTYVYTTTLTNTETSAITSPPAQTGGNGSSFWMGP